MGLFHPLIQLSFAVIHGDNKLIANALAYFAIRYKNLYRHYPQRSLAQTSEVSALTTWASITKNLDKLRVSFNPRGGSLGVCEQLCGESSIAQLALGGGFVINQQNLHHKIAEISQAAIRLYLAEPALTTLHGVTSCQALADLTLRYGRGQKESQTFIKLWSLYWVWLTGLYLEKGFPQALPQVSGDKTAFDDWDVMAKKARKMPDVHLIKMVYSCQWLSEHIDNY